MAKTQKFDLTEDQQFILAMAVKVINEGIEKGYALHRIQMEDGTVITIKAERPSSGQKTKIEGNTSSTQGLTEVETEE